jgi:hypothetical protein
MLPRSSVKGKQTALVPDGVQETPDAGVQDSLVRTMTPDGVQEFRLHLSGL